MTAPTHDLSAAYRDVRARIVELVTAPDVDVNAHVPATPAWRIKDVVGHLGGVCVDILDGNLEGLATDPWTAAQVERRKDTSIDELVREWTEASEKVEPIIPMFPGRSGPQFVGDVVSHEHDLRAALGRQGERDSAATAIGIEFMVGSWLHYGVRPASLPPLLVDSGERQWSAGDGDAPVTLRAEPFELLRATTGRRSRAQIASLDWSADPEPYLPTFVWGPFRPAESDLLE